MKINSVTSEKCGFPCESVSHHISLSSNKLYPRVGKLGREQRPRSLDDVAEFSYVFPTRVKSIFCGFRVDFKINIIQVHIIHPLKRMIKTQSFPNVNRIYITKSDCSSQNKDSIFVMNANVDAHFVTLTGERLINVAFHAAMLGRLPSRLGNSWNSTCSCWLENRRNNSCYERDIRARSCWFSTCRSSSQAFSIKAICKMSVVNQGPRSFHHCYTSFSDAFPHL